MLSTFPYMSSKEDEREEPAMEPVCMCVRVVCFFCMFFVVVVVVSTVSFKLGYCGHFCRRVVFSD